MVEDRVTKIYVEVMLQNNYLSFFMDQYELVVFVVNEDCWNKYIITI